VASAPEPRNALIIDDEESTRRLIGRIVTQELDARVTLAGTCEEALHSAESKTFDVILLDLLMPGIGGFEVLRQIRARGANRTTPILVLSVMSDHESRERCRLLGASAFLAKPVDRELVTTMLHSLLAPKHGGTSGSAGVSVEKGG
jgi:two-component system sensor histidine kinase RpfC